MTSEDYEAAFGAVTEDDSKTAVNLNMYRRCDRAAKRAAAQAGMSLSNYIESLL